MTEKEPGRLSNSNWCPHDLDTTADPKIVALMGKYGGNGYAVFWRLTELLHKADGNKLNLSDEFILEAIAGQFKLQVSEVQEIINYCVKPCKLFAYKDGMLYSDRVLRNIERRKEIKEKRRNSGSKGGKSKANAKQMLPNGKQVLANAKQNVAEESRVDKIPLKGILSERYYVPKAPGSAHALLRGMVEQWPGMDETEKAEMHRLCETMHESWLEETAQDFETQDDLGATIRELYTGGLRQYLTERQVYNTNLDPL